MAASFPEDYRRLSAFLLAQWEVLDHLFTQPGMVDPEFSEEARRYWQVEGQRLRSEIDRIRASFSVPDVLLELVEHGLIGDGARARLEVEEKLRKSWAREPQPDPRRIDKGLDLAESIVGSIPGAGVFQEGIHFGRTLLNRRERGER